MCFVSYCTFRVPCCTVFSVLLTFTCVTFCFLSMNVTAVKWKERHWRVWVCVCVCVSWSSSAIHFSWLGSLRSVLARSACSGEMVLYLCHICQALKKNSHEDSSKYVQAFFFSLLILTVHISGCGLNSWHRPDNMKLLVGSVDVDGAVRTPCHAQTVPADCCWLCLSLHLI